MGNEYEDGDKCKLSNKIPDNTFMDDLEYKMVQRIFFETSVRKNQNEAKRVLLKAFKTEDSETKEHYRSNTVFG